MVQSGIVAGDVIASVISNSVDAMAICLAALSIGAVWTSSSCDLGSAGIIDRYKQISPKLIFADNGYIYAGKTINLQDRIADWSHKLGYDTSKLTNVVVIHYCKFETDLAKVYLGCTLQAFLERGSDEALSFKMLPFSHPAFILYSSGTACFPLI
jgi:acetoacetyl-CoA synthetase